MNKKELMDFTKKIIKLWPTSLTEDEVQIRHKLQGLVVDELSVSSFRNIARGRWALLSDPLVQGSLAKCIFFDNKDPSVLVLAEFYKPEGWVLSRFDAQCPVCFGSGMNDNRVCEFCFGCGWGERRKGVGRAL